MTQSARPHGITAIALFFVFGTVMSGFSALMLSFPGGYLEPLWRLNPEAHAGFVRMGSSAVLLMVTVCAACAISAIGIWRCARWGYLAAIGVLSINLIGDSANAFFGHDRRTLIGLPIAGAMIAYLIRNRQVFPAK